MSWVAASILSPETRARTVNSALESLVQSAVREVLHSKAEILMKFSESMLSFDSDKDDSWPYFPEDVVDFFEHLDTRTNVIRFPITQDDIAWIKKSIQVKLSSFPELIRTGVALDNGVLPRVLESYLWEALNWVHVTDSNWTYFVEINISQNLRHLQWRINESFTRVLDSTLVSYLEQLVSLFREYETKLAEAIETGSETPQLQSFWKNWWGKSATVVDVYWDQDFILVDTRYPVAKVSEGRISSISLNKDISIGDQDWIPLVWEWESVLAYLFWDMKENWDWTNQINWSKVTKLKNALFPRWKLYSWVDQHLQNALIRRWIPLLIVQTHPKIIDRFPDSFQFKVISNTELAVLKRVLLRWEQVSRLLERLPAPQTIKNVAKSVARIVYVR